MCLIEEIFIGANKRYINSIIILYTQKNINQLILEFGILNNIHAILLIEEYARSFRKEVTLIIPKQPIQALIIMDSIIKFLFTLLKSKNGINFCHVLRIIKLPQDIPSLMSGNQKNIGNTPSFVRRANLTISLGCILVNIK